MTRMRAFQCLLHHSRYLMVPLAQPAAVSVYRDGSVVVAHAGVELGQGLSTKVKQVAIYELSTLLGDGRRVPWEHVRTADNSSELLPNGPCTGGALLRVVGRRATPCERGVVVARVPQNPGSTTSEASCQAVRMACRELVQRMRPFVSKGGSWQDVCEAAMPGYIAVARAC